MDDASISEYIGEMVHDIMHEIRFVHQFRGTSNIVCYEDYRVIEKEDGPGVNILIRMEVLESVEKIMVSKNLLEPDAIKLGIDICKALELLAKNKTIHRDIKPDNILLSKHGDYKLADFGIAREIDRTTSGMSKKGTYNYMAPEVFKGLDYGASVDLYSLGMVLYRIVNNNRLPFLPVHSPRITLKDREDSLGKRMKGEPLPLPVNASPELSAVILKACAYNRMQRYQSATEMRAALEDLASPKSSKTMTKLSEQGLISEADYEDTVLDEDIAEGLSEKREDSEASPSEENKGNGPKPSEDDKISKEDKDIIPEVSQKSAPEADEMNDADTVLDESAEESSKNAQDPIAAENLNKTASRQSESDSEMPKEIISAQVKINGKFYKTSLTTLTISDNNLTDLKPLSYFKNLTSLRLDCKSLADLSPLSKLTNLVTLKIRSKLLSDLSPLSELVNLIELDLSNCNITSLKPLASLNNLSTLKLSFNNIANISALSGLKSLTEVNLIRNNVFDLSPLSELDNLIKLDLLGNKISDFTPLYKLKNLKKLGGVPQKYIDDMQRHQSATERVASEDLASPNISKAIASPSKIVKEDKCILPEVSQKFAPEADEMDYDDTVLDESAEESSKKAFESIAAENLNKTVYSQTVANREIPKEEIPVQVNIGKKHFKTSLTALKISDKNLTDLGPLRYFKNLTSLHLNCNNLSDLSPLSNLKNLITLKIESTLLSDLSPLSGLVNLKYLDLSHCNITYINPLANLKNLSKLDLDYNQITDISPLARLSLTTLYLSSNKLKDISSLEGLSLKSLSISLNDIANISALARLKNLSTLFLTGTNVSDLSPLSELDNLLDIYLSYTEISDFSPLYKLKNIKKLDGVPKKYIADVKHNMPNCKVVKC
jgi:Leucine-rich repeat (LRR) protein